MSKRYQHELEMAKKELDQFLDEHPEMREYQKELDRLLDASSNRLEVIGIMLASKISELYRHTQELLYSLEAFSRINPQKKPQ